MAVGFGLIGIEALLADGWCVAVKRRVIAAEDAGPSDEIEMRFEGLGSWFRVSRIIAQSMACDHGVISAFQPQ